MSIQTRRDQEGMARVGRVVRDTLGELRRQLRPGITTAELDRHAAATLAAHGARSAPRLFYGIPAAALVSVNDEAAHALPGPRVIRAGDLVKLDVTAELNGFIADAAVTLVLPPVSPTKRRLVECAEAAFRSALRVARAGRPIGDIGRAVERVVRRRGFAVIRELYGHGVGRAIHEEPTIPNYDDPAEPRLRQPLTEGLVITIEPMISSGSGSLVVDADGWTVRTADGSPAAHYEHTLVITRGRPRLLTA